MRLNPRKIRIGISAMILTLFLLVFLGDENLSKTVSGTLLYFQFFPSLIRFITEPGCLLGTGFFLIILLSFAFGRVYCSFLCPLGILQDVFNRISKITGLKKKHVFQKPHPAVRYGIASVTFATAVMGTFVFVNLLEPYSLFGRIAAHPFKAIALLSNNTVTGMLETFDIYLLPMRKQHCMPLSVLAATAFSFSIIITFSALYGRLYCNTICPVGAVLGLISRYSLYQFAMDREKCGSCGLCESACKAGCIDAECMNIDTTRCVACFNCLEVCKKKAMTYGFSIRPSVTKMPVPSRRTFLLSSATVGASILFASYPFHLSHGEIAPFGNMPVVPPGSSGFDHFTETCTACHLCVSVCPTNVITPTFYDYGVSGLLQPKMVFNKGYCDFECNACGHVCPTGAISALSLNDKKRVRIGTVSLNKQRCIVHVKKKHCGACGEACPTRAISPIEKGRVLFPKINTDYCIGCGACEHACPTKPKAIIVTAKRVHEKAKDYIPKEALVRPPVSQDGGFPF